MSSFLPCQDDIVLSDWATQLDRIFIPHSGNRFLRLVGPENAINLHLEPPRRGSLATLQVTGTPLLTYPEGLELKEISNAKCFADVYMLLEQQGLTKWHYPEPSHPMYHFHTSFWMYDHQSFECTQTDPLQVRDHESPRLCSRMLFAADNELMAAAIESSLGSPESRGSTPASSSTRIP